CSSNPAIRSESWTFIWQPNVSIRYFRAMSVCGQLAFLSAPAFRSCPRLASVFHVVSVVRLESFATFAFAFCFRFSRACAGAPFKHLTRRGPRAIGCRITTYHPRELCDTIAPVQPAHVRQRPAGHEPLVDVKMRVGVGGDLREVRDAQHLKP